jgi:hypothetical protein
MSLEWGWSLTKNFPSICFHLYKSVSQCNTAVTQTTDSQLLNRASKRTFISPLLDHNLVNDRVKPDSSYNYVGPAGFNKKTDVKLTALPD